MALREKVSKRFAQNWKTARGGLGFHIPRNSCPSGSTILCKRSHPGDFLELIPHCRSRRGSAPEHLVSTRMIPLRCR